MVKYLQTQVSFYNFAYYDLQFTVGVAWCLKIFRKLVGLWNKNPFNHKQLSHDLDLTQNEIIFEINLNRFNKSQMVYFTNLKSTHYY